MLRFGLVHKLTNSFQGLGIEGNGRGARHNALNYMGMSNEAHMEHHNDLVTGQGNCVSCHIAIQTNCNACTSAGAGTHAEQSPVNTGGETSRRVVRDAEHETPFWK